MLGWFLFNDTLQILCQYVYIMCMLLTASITAVLNLFKYSLILEDYLTQSFNWILEIICRGHFDCELCVVPWCNCDILPLFDWSSIGNFDCGSVMVGSGVECEILLAVMFFSVWLWYLHSLCVNSDILFCLTVMFSLLCSSGLFPLISDCHCLTSMHYCVGLWCSSSSVWVGCSPWSLFDGHCLTSMHYCVGLWCSCSSVQVGCSPWSLFDCHCLTSMHYCVGLWCFPVTVVF